jgi:hypothetical protein
MDMGKLTGWLWSNHKISTGGQGHPEIMGIRVTPNVYTSLDELDRFVDKTLIAIKQGIS